MLVYKRFVGLILLGLSLSLVACDSTQDLAWQGPTMGSSYKIRIQSPKPVDKASLQGEVALVLGDVDRLFSTYRDDSWVSQFNRLGPNQCLDYALFSVHPLLNNALYTVLKEAQYWAHLSGGQYDITTKPWTDALTSNTSKPHSLSQNRPFLKEYGNYQNLDVHSTRACKTKFIELDPNSLVAGFAVDTLVQYFRKQGIEDALIDVTGEVYGARSPSHAPWRIGIEAPQSGQSKALKVVSLANLGVSTSGNYRRQELEHDAKASHFYDPFTQQSVQGKLLSVTVLNKQTLRADALSTLLMVMGLEAGRKFANQHGLAVVWVYQGDGGAYQTVMTESFKPYLIER